MDSEKISTESEGAAAISTKEKLAGTQLSVGRVFRSGQKIFPGQKINFGEKIPGLSRRRRFGNSMPGQRLSTTPP